MSDKPLAPVSLLVSMVSRYLRSTLTLSLSLSLFAIVYVCVMVDLFFKIAQRVFLRQAGDQLPPPSACGGDDITATKSDVALIKPPDPHRRRATHNKTAAMLWAASWFIIYCDMTKNCLYVDQDSHKWAMKHPNCTFLVKNLYWRHWSKTSDPCAITITQFYKEETDGWKEVQSEDVWNPYQNPQKELAASTCSLSAESRRSLQLRACIFTFFWDFPVLFSEPHASRDSVNSRCFATWTQVSAMWQLCVSEGL